MKQHQGQDIQRKGLERNGHLVSKAGRNAAKSVCKGVTATTGPGIIQITGNTASPCRRLEKESMTKIMSQGIETADHRDHQVSHKFNSYS